MDGWFADSSAEIRPLGQTVGLIVPHAGYMYSGAIAAAGFAAILPRGKPDVVILLGANHSGKGAELTLPPHAGWETPLGRSAIGEPLRTRLESAGISIDAASFAREHSMEVQLPFIQYLWGCDIPILPLCVQPSASDRSESIAETIAQSLDVQTALFIASSDFTHYEAAAHAEALDAEALTHIHALDLEGFDRHCQGKGLSICGTGAISLLMALALRLEFTHTEIIRYATSGAITGDTSSVVGYAAVTMTKENYG